MLRNSLTLIPSLRVAATRTWSYAFRNDPIRNVNARCTCPPERVDGLREGERCKRNDGRTAGRVLQRIFFLVQDGLGFAGCSSDFDPLWPTAPPRRGYSYRRVVGRKLR